MSTPATRRGLLAGAGGAAAAAGFLTSTPPARAVAILRDDDAELIRACEQHCINMDAFNGAEIDEGDRLWAAYSKTRDFISSAAPRTMAGVLAKARAARHEAVDRSGEERWGGSMGEAWALDIVNDLLRLTAVLS